MISLKRSRSRRTRRDNRGQRTAEQRRHQPAPACQHAPGTAARSRGVVNVPSTSNAATTILSPLSLALTATPRACPNIPASSWRPHPDRRSPHRRHPARSSRTPSPADGRGVCASRDPCSSAVRSSARRSVSAASAPRRRSSPHRSPRRSLSLARMKPDAADRASGWSANAATAARVGTRSDMVDHVDVDAVAAGHRSRRSSLVVARRQLQPIVASTSQNAASPCIEPWSGRAPRPVHRRLPPQPTGSSAELHPARSSSRSRRYRPGPTAMSILADRHRIVPELGHDRLGDVEVGRDTSGVVIVMRNPPATYGPISISAVRNWLLMSPRTSHGRRQTRSGPQTVTGRCPQRPAGTHRRPQARPARRAVAPSAGREAVASPSIVYGPGPSAASAVTNRDVVPAEPGGQRVAGPGRQRSATCRRWSRGCASAATLDRIPSRREAGQHRLGVVATRERCAASTVRRPGQRRSARGWRCSSTRERRRRRRSGAAVAARRRAATSPAVALPGGTRAPSNHRGTARRSPRRRARPPRRDCPRRCEPLRSWRC